MTSGDVICAGDADGVIVAEATGGSGDLFLTNQFATVGAADGLLDLGPAVYQAWVMTSSIALLIRRSSPSENQRPLS